MIRDFLYRIIERRHFWRYATFSEIAELYASRTVRVIALNIVSGFTTVFMYESGYSIPFIAAFWVYFYLAKIPLTFLAGMLISRFGPKHGILVSNLLYVPALTALGMLSTYGLTSIIIWGVFVALSSTIYKNSYMVDFSKVKNVEHAGKEIAFMNILEKVSIGVSPIIGGVIALKFGLPMVMWLAAILFVLSAIPLFRSMEPVETHQKMHFKGFPIKSNLSNLIAQTGVGFDIVTTGTVWHLFIVVAVFPGHGWDIYVKLGILSSVTIVTALLASYAYGKLIDNSRGGGLLKISVIANAAVHIGRAFSNNVFSIVNTNVANEVATTGYNMAFMRGVFDAADLSGHRILYLCISDALANLGAAIACLFLLVFVSNWGAVEGMRLFFMVAAAFVLLIGTAKFNLYRKNSVIY